MRYKSIEEQKQKFISILKQNEDLMSILDYVTELKLQNFYIAVGSIFSNNLELL
jgi:hypothetical protein